MKIALLGANGQLAFDLTRTLGNHELIPFTRSDFDVTDSGAMGEALEDARPEVIINTTAFHRVDICESAAEEAFRVNAVAPFHLASTASRLGALLVHISTDYVFDGEADKPYVETDAPGPTSVYANSKLAGEYFVRSVTPDHLLIRTCGLYGVAGSSGKGGNFVETMLRKAEAGDDIFVVSDQIVTPTPTTDLARQISLLLDKAYRGLVHCSAEGSCSWYEFARAIFELSGIDGRPEPTTAQFHKTPARRPSYSVLENHRLKQDGLNVMPDWRQGLAGYLKEKHGIALEIAADKTSG